MLVVRQEFLARVKRLVVAPDGTGSDVWYKCVRPTVKDCFHQLAGGRVCARSTLPCHVYTSSVCFLRRSRLDNGWMCLGLS